MPIINQTPRHPCTDCGGDALYGISNVTCSTKKKIKQLVGRDERLCFPCAKKRGVPSFIINSSK